MRIAICALSAVLLSGCSWLGNMTGGAFGPSAHNAGGHYGPSKANHCQVPHAQAPLPRGCHPSQVTIGMAGAGYGGQNNQYAGGFSQTPQFGQAQYGAAQNITGGYGSHAANAGAHNPNMNKRLRKPKLRGSLSLGLEKSNAGSLLEYESAGVPNPATTFTTILQQSREGSPQDGLIVTGIYTADADAVAAPSISFDDVHSTPMRLAGGVEYILTPKTTVFANAGYSYAEGDDGGATIIGTITGDLEFQAFENNAPFGRPFNPEGVEILENQSVARYVYQFTDMHRIDLEAGGRHYLNPIMKNSMSRTVTPFVGASVGVSHYNAVNYDINEEHLRLDTAFLSAGEDLQYDVQQGPRQTVELYDSQWVPSGQLNAGLEWQATPKTAIAFETGLRFEGARDYSNGAKGDNNIAIPFTIRGSYNF